MTDDANTDVKIAWNSGDPGWKGGTRPAAIELAKDDTVTLSWDDAPSGTTVGFSEVLFYHNKLDENGKDAKDLTNSAGTWTQANGASKLTNFVVSETDGVLTIKDNEAISDDTLDKYWYAIKLKWNDGSDHYKDLDPELINKKKKTT